MDDSLLADFHAVFSVSGEANDPHAPHPHYTLYKRRKEGYGDQEDRRRKLLEKQRSRRKDFADYARKIARGETWEEEMEEGSYDEVDTGAPEPAPGCEEPPKWRQQERKQVHPWRNQLMLSEWLLGVPQAFEQEWLMVVCPVGRRSLVVATRKTTSAYSRSGQCLNNFPSLLPGGCHRTHRTADDFTILDCIHHEASRTYYVLDVMCWRGHPVYNCDTEFRMFWLRTKLAEAGEAVAGHSRINPLRFLPLDNCPCDRASVAAVLAQRWPVQVDGLLFLHRRAHYTTGRSPLALWLKPHMVPDLLSIPVSQEFLDCAPTLSHVEMELCEQPAKDSEGAPPLEQPDKVSEGDPPLEQMDSCAGVGCATNSTDSKGELQ